MTTTFSRNITIVGLLALSAAARAADVPPVAKPGQTSPAGAGGDGGAKAKAASVVIQEIATDDAPPPAPVGDEKNAIGAYIRENHSPIEECYARALEKRPTLQGKLVARFDIGPSGRVIGATADGIQDRDLLLCVVQVVRKWEFKKPESGGKLRISYPFKFEAKASR